MTKRISPFTDFGFKYLFGQEDNKDLLIDFLNTLLVNEPGFEPIVDVSYADKEFPKSPESECFTCLKRQNRNAREYWIIGCTT